jgi:hypothetical protein
MKRAMLAYSSLSGLMVAVMMFNPTTAEARMSARQGSSGIGARLTRIQDLRQSQLIPSDDDQNFSFDKPGLTLTFAIQLADGRQLLELQQPLSFKATDSTNRDLSAIEPGFSGGREYVEVLQSWDSSPSEFRFKLANPDRSATRFSLNATLDAVTYTGTETVVVDVSSKWTMLDTALFNGQDIKCKLTANNGTMQLTFEPGTIKAQIEKISLSDGTTAMETNSSWWNDQSITYIFDGKPMKNVKAQLMIRTGIETTPLEISIKDQPLP